MTVHLPPQALRTTQRLKSGGDANVALKVHGTGSAPVLEWRGGTNTELW